MITVLLAGTKMPRPRPARVSCGTTVAWVTGTTIDAHMTAQVSSAPAKPRRRSPQAFGSTRSPNSAASPKPSGRAESSRPVRAALPGPRARTCGISTSGPNSAR